LVATVRTAQQHPVTNTYHLITSAVDTPQKGFDFVEWFIPFNM
jgi:hypothetical protein